MTMAIPNVSPIQHSSLEKITDETPNYVMQISVLVALVLAHLSRIAQHQSEELSRERLVYLTATNEVAKLQKNQGWLHLTFAITPLTMTVAGVGLQISGRTWGKGIGEAAPFVGKFGDVGQSFLQADITKANGLVHIAETDENRTDESRRRNTDSTKSIEDLLQTALQTKAKASQGG